MKNLGVRLHEIRGKIVKIELEIDKLLFTQATQTHRYEELQKQIDEKRQQITRLKKGM